jgi:hypothetical protein
MSGGDESFSIAGFSFSARAAGQIAGARELDALSAGLGLAASAAGGAPPPLPEMVFVRGALRVAHAASGLELAFSAEGALRAWNARQRRERGADAPGAPPVDASRFDWTYSSDFVGDLGAAARLTRTAGAEMPLDALRRRGRILFFAHIPLFASDLSDRGLAECSVKLRVMEDCFLVLLRAYVRVDRERVWLHEARYAHEFGSALDCGMPRVVADVQLRRVALPPVDRLHEEVIEPAPLPSFFSAKAGPAALASDSPTDRGSVDRDRAARTLPAALSAASATPGESPPRRTVHPVVLESVRARAALLGLGVSEAGEMVSVESSRVLPPAAGSAPSFLATSVAAHFPGAGAAALPLIPFVGRDSGHALLQRLDLTADEVREALSPVIHDVFEVEVDSRRELSSSCAATASRMPPSIAKS